MESIRVFFFSRLRWLLFSHEVLPDDARAACGTGSSIFRAIAPITSIAALSSPRKARVNTGYVLNLGWLAKSLLCHYEKKMSNVKEQNFS